jgi:hypothetical protein
MRRISTGFSNHSHGNSSHHIWWNTLSGTPVFVAHLRYYGARASRSRGAVEGTLPALP